MSTASEPFVSVVTPVHNGAPYLGQCIASVLAQTYQHYEYIIVDNCSGDATPDIAEACARQDSRINVVRSSSFAGIIENHNRAFRLISPHSTYCKVVSADDWLYPECITKLVELAELHPTTGIVGSYATNGDGIRWLGLPHDAAFFTGRDVCRRYLLGLIDFCGTPSAVLYRSGLVRSTGEFFPGPDLNADVTAFLNCLQVSDFAVAHQILSFERIHEGAASTRLRELNAFLVDRLEFLLRFGPRCLTTDESATRLEELLDAYYVVLASAVVNRPGNDFWHYHARRLRAIGLGFDRVRLAKAVASKASDLLFNPKQTAEKLLKRRSHGRHADGPSVASRIGRQSCPSR